MRSTYTTGSFRIIVIVVILYTYMYSHVLCMGHELTKSGMKIWDINTWYITFPICVRCMELSQYWIVIYDWNVHCCVNVFKYTHLVLVWIISSDESRGHPLRNSRRLYWLDLTDFWLLYGFIRKNQHSSNNAIHYIMVWYNTEVAWRTELNYTHQKSHIHIKSGTPWCLLHV